MKTIYTLVESDTRKIRYVGRTGINLDHRSRLHWLRRNDRDTPVYLWLRQFNEPAPIEVLQEVEDHEWVAAEKYWISLLAQVPSVDLLNVQGRPDRDPNYQSKSESTKRKISETLQGYEHAEEARNNMSIASFERERCRVKMKLTVDEVREIRLSSLSNTELALMYDVTYNTIRHIRHRLTWKHVD